MRPSSSPSDRAGSALFAGVLSRSPVAEAVSDAAWLRALLDVEAALAVANAAAGLIPATAATAITAACRDASVFDPRTLGEQAAAAGNPVLALVGALEVAVGEEGGGYVHRGATSQDIIDTAAMLVTKRALDLIVDDVEGVADEAAALAERHLRTPMAGRTLMQQAVATTFGRKAAGWTAGADACIDRLVAVRDGLPLQLGGAVGTLAAFEAQGSAVAARMAEDLQLMNPVLPWHTIRAPIADIAGALGGLAGLLGKIAGDLILMAQTEVAEVSEQAPGRGGSSTMPHKHNPVAAISARASAMRAPGLVSTLLQCCMAQEHERAAGAWHAEWETLPDLVRCTGSAASWLRESLRSLQVDERRMRANLQLSGPSAGAEAVAGHLSVQLGRGRAHQLVAQASAAATTAEFRERLLSHADVGRHLTAEHLDELLDPAASVSDAVSQALAATAAHHARRAGS